MNHDIISIAESVPFSSKDINSINAARQQAAEINETINKILADPSHAPSESYFSWLHHEVDRVEKLLIDWPSHENAERLHSALIRFDTAKDTQNRVSSALGIALSKVSQSVAGIVQGHLDKCRERIEAEATSRRAELAATRHGLFNNSDESRALEARVQGLINALNSEREEAAKCALSWLDRAGLCMEPPQADTEAA